MVPDNNNTIVVSFFVKLRLPNILKNNQILANQDEVGRKQVAAKITKENEE